MQTYRYVFIPENLLIFVNVDSFDATKEIPTNFAVR